MKLESYILQITRKDKIMEKQVLIQELQELENKIKMCERSAKDSYFGGAHAEAAKVDMERFQYQYKVKTVALSDEDRKELAQMAADKNIKLEFIFELVFSEDEKEEYEELQSFWGKPTSEDFAELDARLDEEEKNKIKVDQETVHTKKRGFHLFGRK